MSERKSQSGNIVRKRLHEIIFESDTSAEKLFNLTLISSIIVSVLVVMLDSINKLQAEMNCMI